MKTQEIKSEYTEQLLEALFILLDDVNFSTFEISETTNGVKVLIQVPSEVEDPEVGEEGISKPAKYEKISVTNMNFSDQEVQLKLILLPFFTEPGSKVGFIIKQNEDDTSELVDVCINEIEELNKYETMLTLDGEYLDELLGYLFSSFNYKLDLKESLSLNELLSKRRKVKRNSRLSRSYLAKKSKMSDPVEFRKRSRAMKLMWKRNRSKITRAIKKYNKSPEGRRLRKLVGKTKTILGA